MVFIKPDSFKFNIESVFYVFAYLFYCFGIFIVEKQIFSILYTEDHMIFYFENFM